jgi:integrase/recombinase XerD
MSKLLKEKLSLQEVLKGFLFDCKLRKSSERTTKSYKNNNLSFFRYIETECELTEVWDLPDRK